MKLEKKLRVMIKATIKEGLHKWPALYVDKLNLKLKGWINYYKIDGVTQMYNTLNRVAGYLGERIYIECSYVRVRTDGAGIIANVPIRNLLVNTI